VSIQLTFVRLSFIVIDSENMIQLSSTSNIKVMRK